MTGGEPAGIPTMEPHSHPDDPSWHCPDCLTVVRTGDAVSALITGRICGTCGNDGRDLTDRRRA